MRLFCVIMPRFLCVNMPRFLLADDIFIDKNLEMSIKLFKFANDNLLLTIGG